MGKQYQYRHSNEYLKPEDVCWIEKLAVKAWERQTPLNRHFTIHLEDTLAQENPQRFMSHIMENTRHWLKYRGFSNAYLWVLENGKYKGIHVHLIIFIPEGLQVDYKRRLKTWSASYAINDIKVKSIGYPIYGNLHPLSQLYGVLKYICKGVSKNPGTFSNGLYQAIKASYQGEIIGRRWGTNIKKYF